MHPGAIALRDQFRLGIQPMLDVLPLRRALLDITEVGPPGDLVWRWGKINFVLVRFRRACRPGCARRGMVLRFGEFMLFHKKRMNPATAGPPWGVHPKFCSGLGSMAAALSLAKTVESS